MYTNSRTIGRNMSWNAFGSLFYLGCQYLMTILIVKLSGSFADAGIFSLAISIYNIFQPLANYRMYTYQVSDIHGENSTGEYLAFRLLTCALALFLLTGYAMLTCSADAWLTIILFAAYKFASLILNVLHGCNQLHDRMDFTGKSLFLQGLVSITIFIAVLWHTSSLEITVAAMIAGVILVGIVYDLPRTAQFGTIRFGISRKKTIYLLGSCVPIVIAGIATSAAPSLPRQYFSNIAGSAALGIYASIAAPVAIIQMGAQYVYNPLLSYFSDAYLSGDIKGFRRLFIKTTLAIVLVAALCSAGLLLFGEGILALFFGDSIREYVYLLQPLVWLAACTGYSWFLNDLNICVRNFKASFIGSMSSLIAMLLLMVPVVSRFGMVGVSAVTLVSTMLSVLVLAGMLYSFMERSKGNKPLSC